jgi:alpha-L-fucosidase
MCRNCLFGLWIAMVLLAHSTSGQPLNNQEAGEAEETEGTTAATRDFGMGPPTSRETVAKAFENTPPIHPGRYEPTWESIKQNYQTPRWFRDGKFGIMMHWGLYSVPAYHNEWYEKYIYGNPGIRDWHLTNYGSLDAHGYVALADRFATKFDADAWAELCQKAGATYVVPCAEHHDWFSLWASDVSPWNAAKMGPKRDLIGELAVAVRKRGMKFGVSNHSIEHYTFINQLPPAELKTDLRDPQYEDFYWVNHDNQRLTRFLELWVLKNFELIDNYQVDMLWFDNGINSRVYDPLKLKVAAYYYNRAAEWNKEVSICAKSKAYLAGSIMDFERQGRAPKTLTDFVWQPDDPIGPTFGYTTVDRGKGDRDVDMTVTSVGAIVSRLVQNVSRNGNYLLNISPRGDGSIPENQQRVLLGIGKWLETNGEAIYGTRPWKMADDQGKIYFTKKGDTLYAIALRWPGETLTIRPLAKGAASANAVAKQTVSLLGHEQPLEFSQDEEGLKIRLPDKQVGEHAFAFKLTGFIIDE